jgi:Flp pilus assembly protein TadG
VRRRRERGSAVVEFALLLPLLLVMLLALVQIGVLARDRLLVAEAARAGARAAATHDSVPAVSDAAVAAGAGLDPSRIGVEVERTGGRGDPVSVAVSYDAPVMGVLLGWLMPTTVMLASSSTVRQEFG